MDPRTGFTYNLTDEADPPVLGAKIDAFTALASGYVELGGVSEEKVERLEQMAKNHEELVAVGAEAAQRARLGDRELRRRRQRRR
jgi:hypothetical protein